MRRNPSKSWRHQKELLEPRRSNSARFSGTTTQKKKQLGSEKMNFEKTTRTYLLANLNLEGEIHLKVVRLVTSQILKIRNAYMDSYHHGIALHLKFLKLVLLSFGSKPLSTYIYG
jgi:hypothetical protein